MMRFILCSLCFLVSIPLMHAADSTKPRDSASRAPVTLSATSSATTPFMAIQHVIELLEADKCRDLLVLYAEPNIVAQMHASLGDLDVVISQFRKEKSAKMLAVMKTVKPEHIVGDDKRVEVRCQDTFRMICIDQRWYIKD